MCLPERVGARRRTSRSLAIGRRRPWRTVPCARRFSSLFLDSVVGTCVTPGSTRFVGATVITCHVREVSWAVLLGLCPGTAAPSRKIIEQSTMRSSCRGRWTCNPVNASSVASASLPEIAPPRRGRTFFGVLLGEWRGVPFQFNLIIRGGEPTVGKICSTMMGAFLSAFAAVQSDSSRRRTVRKHLQQDDGSIPIVREAHWRCQEEASLRPLSPRLSRAGRRVDCVFRRFVLK